MFFILTVSVLNTQQQWSNATKYIDSSTKLMYFYFSCHFLLLLHHISEGNILFTLYIKNFTNRWRVYKICSQINETVKTSLNQLVDWRRLSWINVTQTVLLLILFSVYTSDNLCNIERDVCRCGWMTLKGQEVEPVSWKNHVECR